MNKSVKLKNQYIKNDTDKLTLISGPCLLESEKLVRLVTRNLIDYTKKGRRKSIKSHVVFEFDFSESHYSQFVKEKKLTPEECSLICIRTKKWKYVHFPNLPALLFDLENDPQEMKNLAEDKKYQEIKNKLMSDLLSHRLRHQDRQLSSLQVSKDGVAKVNGPQSRKMIN